eukprot:COSAG03_NODE_3848_length_1796_cov_3.434885_2_plen_58_part_00
MWLPMIGKQLQGLFLCRRPLRPAPAAVSPLPERRFLLPRIVLPLPATEMKSVQPAVS